MDLVTWLQSLVASDGAHVAAAAAAVGVIVFALINFADAQFQLNNEVKFWGSIALAFALPVIAYIALQLLTSHPLEVNGFFLAASVGWLVSQGIHRVQEVKQKSRG